MRAGGWTKAGLRAVLRTGVCGLAVLGLAAALPARGAGDDEWLDTRGRVVRLPLTNGWLPCKSELAVAGSNWNSVAYLSGAEKLQSVVGASGAVWRAELTQQTRIRVSQVVQVFSNGVQLNVTAVADRTNECAGVFLVLHLPADRFAGGRYLSGAVTGRLPVARADPYQLAYVSGNRLELSCAQGSAGVRIESEGRGTLLVQDNRRWSDEFAVVVPLHNGALPPGRTIATSVRLTGVGEARTPLTEVEVDPARTLYRFEGFGGNYCYGLQGLLARTAYATLRPVWARVQMRLEGLQRPPAGVPPEEDFLRQMAALDRPESDLRQGLEFQALLATNQTPCFIALWNAPPWMYVDGVAHPDKNVLKPSEWTRLATAAGAYLRYARERYGVEPEAFSLNEPDGGYNIRVPSAAYPGLVRQFAAEWQRLGVRTRLLLGDVANARSDAYAWLQPALVDPMALRPISWLSFHAWGGAAPDEYAAWAALADRLRLPLVVGEVGVDPDWKRAPIYRHDYAMQEMALYFALLQHARPQAVLLWEHTDNYPVLARDADGRFATTVRWGLQRQWILNTPRGSMAVVCQVLTGDPMDAVAFTHGTDGTGLTVHLGNRQGPRICRISKFPPGIRQLYVVQTTRDHHAEVRPPLMTQQGELRLDLPAESMTTLTTLRPAETDVVK
jgi:hypothetical protein